MTQVFKQKKFRNVFIALIFLCISQVKAQEISKDIPLLFDDPTPIINNQVHGSWFLMGASAMAWFGALYFQNQVEINRDRAKEAHSDYLMATDDFTAYKVLYNQYDNRRKGAEFGRNLSIGLAVLSTLTFAVAITF